jgi:hypothetical protein
MADFQSVISYFESRNLSYFPFYPNSEKPIKPVIRHLPQNTPDEGISDGLISLGFDVINVKQMTTTRRPPPEETKVITLPLFLVTLPRTPKSQDIFRLPHRYQQGGVVQEPKFPYAEPQLPAVWLRMGKL